MEAGQGSVALTDHSDKVRRAAFSPDGSRIVTSSADSTARLWDRAGKQVTVLAGDARSVRHAAFSPDGSRIVAIVDSPDHAVRLWDRDGKQFAALAGHTDAVCSAAFSPDGRRIVTASMDSTARLWDTDGKQLAVLAGHAKSVRNAEFSRDGSRIVTTSADHTVRLWGSGGEPLAVLAIDGVRHATLSPDGNRIATIAEAKDRTATLWDSEGKVIAVLAGHTDAVLCVAFSADGGRLVTGSLDHTARLWGSEGKQLAVLRGHTAAVQLAVFSPDGSCVVTVSDDRMGRLWDREGVLLGVLAGFEGKLRHAAFSPDSTRVIVACEDGTARVFPVRTKPGGPGRLGIPSTALLRFEQGYIPNGMYNSEVRSILQDARGHYWFGTWQDGVCRFDGESLTYFTVGDGLAHNQVSSVREDQTGVIWFGTAGGISSYDGARIITHPDRDYTSSDAWQLGERDFWFEGNDPEERRGVFRHDGARFIFQAFPVRKDRQTEWGYGFTGMSRGKGGRVWFATYNGVIGYDGKAFTLIDNESLGLNEDTGWLHTRSVFEDSLGRLWIGNNGIGVFLREGDTTINFTQAMGVGTRDPHHGGGRMVRQPGDVSEGGASLHRVFAIGEDRAGNIWFGTSAQGAWRYDGKSLRNFRAKDGLTSKSVMAIYTDRRGDLWLGGEGVFRLDGESFDRIH